MAFQIPIQERDSVDLQNIDVPSLQLRPLGEIKDTPMDKIDAIANKMSSQADAIRTKAETFAVQEFKIKSNDIVQGGLNNIVNAKGRDAFVNSDRETKKVKDLQGKLLQSAPEDLKPRLELEAQSDITRFEKTKQGHLYSEKNRLEENTAKISAELETERFASTLDPEQMDRALSNLQTIAITETIRKNGKPVTPEDKQAIVAQVQSATSLAVTKKIEFLASNEDIDTAQDVLSKYEDQITASDRIKINKFLDKGKANRELSKAKKAVDDAMELYPDNPDLMRKYLSAVSGNDGKLYKSAAEMLQGELTFREHQDKLKGEQAVANAFESIRNKAAPLSEILKTVPATEQEKVRVFWQKEQAGENIVTNPEVRAKLRQDMMDNPVRFAKDYNSNKYMDSLDLKDQKFFESQREKILGTGLGQSTAKAVEDITQRVIRTRNANLDYRDEEYRIKKSNIEAIADEIWMGIQETMPNATNQERRKVFEQELMERTRSYEEKKIGWFSWFGIGETISETGPEQDKSQVGLGMSVDRSKIMENYDPALRERVKQDLKKRMGKEPSYNDMIKVLEGLRREAGRAPNNEAPNLNVEIPGAPPAYNPPETIRQTFVFLSAPGRDDFRAFPYDSPEGDGSQTVGYGHKIKQGESFTYPMSPDTARELAMKDLEEYKLIVDSKLHADVSNEMEIVLLDLAFNLGPYHKSLNNTIELLNQGKESEAIKNIGKISMYEGALPGNKKRTQDRLALLQSNKLASL